MHTRHAGFRVVLCLVCAALALVARAQPARQERPRIKDDDFGSSLKRLRWDEEKKAAVEAEPGKGAGKTPDEEEVLSVQTSLVVCDVLVLDRQGRSVQGLTRDDFVVTEDGRPQQITTFALGDNASVPRSIVLILDYSRSLLPYIKTSVAAAKTLIDKLGARDRMAIVTDNVELLANFTSDKEELKRALESLEKGTTSEGSLTPSGALRRQFGRSLQYSALLATLREMFDGEDLRPIVIFQTDGDEVHFLRDPIIPPPKYLQNTVREFSLGDIHRAAEKSRATIYTIIPGPRFLRVTPEEQARLDQAYRERSAPLQLKPGDHGLKIQMALGDVANLTGGWADFLEEPSQAASVYARVLSDINRRYVVGYYPSNKVRDGKRRFVKIEVRGHPDYAVRGRKSYYAPGQ
jgi:Ca-activated chloride channel family protein